jgi:hypothetical protein
MNSPPDLLCYYDEASDGPLRNPFDLPPEAARDVMEQIRGQVYTWAELPALKEQFGPPQIWSAEGELGADRYIEAQVRADAPLQAHLKQRSS